ncbi:unnamed protein product, partial [Didymodactylos carnosus]
VKDRYNANSGSNCGDNPFQDIFLMPGDFHIMKNYMILIWLVLDGIGMDDLFGYIYHGATLRAILNVSHFNKSFRCVKLLYTSLYMLIIEQFHTYLSSSPESSITETLKLLHNVLILLPHTFNTDSVKQSWFSNLTSILNTLNVKQMFDKWRSDLSFKSITFRFWTFVLFDLLEPLIKLYVSIRSADFSSRNAAISLMVLMFFGQKRRSYAPLGARHLADLQRASSYLLKNLSTLFAVQRTNRPFSSIAIDQTIECAINKFGKGRGGITGHFNNHLIEKWCHTFPFRSLLSSVTSEISGYETTTNTIDSHIECSPNRLVVDNSDLQLLLSKLKLESLFTNNDKQLRTLFTGKIIHIDIVENVCSTYDRGFAIMKTYIEERLLKSNIKIEQKIDFGKVLRIIDVDKYVPDAVAKKKDKTPTYNQIEAFIRRLFLIYDSRSIKLNDIFTHEFTEQPVSLCNRKKQKLLYQSTKAVLQKYLQEKFGMAFLESPNWALHPYESALIIDGGLLLQQLPPQVPKKTVADYGAVLLEWFIKDQFKKHDRIDVIFDSSDSKRLKQFIKRHGNTLTSAQYIMNEESILCVGED